MGAGRAPPEALPGAGDAFNAPGEEGERRDHPGNSNKATPSMRRRGTGAHGAALNKAQLSAGRALRGSPASGAGPEPPALPAAPAAPGLLSPPAPPPARARALTLATEEAPQLGED